MMVDRCAPQRAHSDPPSCKTPSGLVVTSAASFAVTAVGRDPLSVWMMAVLVLFSFTYRAGRYP
jgi:hypothetical protein